LTRVIFISDPIETVPIPVEIPNSTVVDDVPPQANHSDVSVVTNISTVITSLTPITTNIRSTTTTELTTNTKQKNDTKGENLNNLFTIFVKTLNFKIYKGTESSIKFCIAETTITSKFWRMSTVI